MVNSLTIKRLPFLFLFHSFLMLHLHSSKQALSTDRDLDIKKNYGWLYRGRYETTVNWAWWWWCYDGNEPETWMSETQARNSPTAKRGDMSKTTLKQNNNIDYANISLGTILGDSMELVEGRQPIAGAWGIPPCCLHPICLHAKSAPHRAGMQPGHAARFCFKALCRALRAGEAFGSEQRLPVNRESLQIEAGEALPHFFHFRCHPFHLFTFFTVYLFEGHFYL